MDPCCVCGFKWNSALAKSGVQNMIPKIDSSPWRQPIFWLALGLPALVVIASVATLMVASKGGSSDAVADDVQRMAQIQTTNLGPDAVAAREHLSALLRMDADALQLQIQTVSGDFDRTGTLRLSLLHPVHARADRSLVLQPTALGWEAQIELDRSHDWQVQLQPEDSRWRLQGRWLKGQASLVLRPALRVHAAALP